MKIVFIVEPYDKSGVAKANVMKSALGNSNEYIFVNMDSGKAIHEYYFDIVNAGANLIVSINGAGLELRTETDEPSLNLIRARVMHLCFATDKCEKLFHEWLNLSHYVFINVENDLEEFCKMHLNLPNVYRLPKWDSENIMQWFEKMSREMMLE